MIYLEDISAPVTVMIPRTIASADTTEAHLRLKGTVSLKTFDIDVIGIVADGGYYAVTADFGPVPEPGEYEYRLTARDGLLASGIIVVRSPRRGVIQYNRDVTYEQYQA